MLFLLVLLLAVTCASAPVAVELTADTFDQFIAENGATIIKFYAPWCGHCKTMAAAYENAAVILAEKDIRIASVESTSQRALADKFGVRGFPTILPFVNGKVQEKYSLPRETSKFVEFTLALQPKQEL